MSSRLKWTGDGFLFCKNMQNRPSTVMPLLVRRGELNFNPRRTILGLPTPDGYRRGRVTHPGLERPGYRQMPLRGEGSVLNRRSGSCRGRGSW